MSEEIETVEVEAEAVELETPVEVEPVEEEGDTFPRAYVEELRAESAANRLKAKRADALEGALQALAIEHYARGVLADTSALLWSEELADEDGLPDGERIREAAEALVRARPSLGRPGGRVLQGEHGEGAPSFSWGVLGRLV